MNPKKKNFPPPTRQICHEIKLISKKMAGDKNKTMNETHTENGRKSPKT